MAITITASTLIGDDLWRLAWTSDTGAPYYVSIDGVLVSTQDSAYYDVRVSGLSYPVVEILDDADEIPQPAHPDHIILGWPADTDVAYYVIEEYSGGGWVTRASVYTDAETPWWTYTTAALADVTVHQWRVTPYDIANNAGTPIAFSTLMVRYPPPPEVEFTYSSGTTKVTVSAA